MKKEILILIGISGSGKTTYAKELCSSNPSFLRINRDDIRKVLVGDLHGYYQRLDLNKIEEQVTILETKIFLSITALDKNVVIDNTNLSEKYINRWRELASDFGMEVKLQFFDMELTEAQQRVYKRDFMGLSYLNKLEVTKYIDKQFQQYQALKNLLK